MRRIPSQTELGTVNGLERAVRELYTMAEEQEIARTTTGIPRGVERFRAEEIEEIRTKLGLDIMPQGQARNVFDAQRDPDPTIDKLDQGFAPGSLWVYITDLPLPSVWLCVESSYEVAAWRELT